MITNLTVALLLAVAAVESNYDKLAVGKAMEVGIMQIGPEAAVDLYRAAYPMPALNHWEPNEAFTAFMAYTDWYDAKSPEQRCRIWNGGPSGQRSDKAKAYAKRVHSEFIEIVNGTKNPPPWAVKAARMAVERWPRPRLKKASRK